MPRWNFITYNGYNLREAGTSGVTEMAVAVSNAINTLEEMIKRGHDVDWIAERLAFFWDPSSDFFEEVARLRAVRKLWYKIMKYRFEAKNPRSMWMRCHVQTSGIALRREEPLNNVARAAYHALSAILGGAQSMHIDSYDEAYNVPTEAAALVSLRTQQILQAETGITALVDPLGGSFYVESLTNEIEKMILDEIDEIESMGGIVAMVETGWLHGKIANYAYHEQMMIENGELPIAGVNYMKSAAEELPQIDVFRYPEGVYEKQCQKVRKLRQERDNSQVEASLRKLEEACRRGENIMPYCIEAARANATEGEMFKVLKKAFGLWKVPSY